MGAEWRTELQALEQRLAASLEALESRIVSLEARKAAQEDGRGLDNNLTFMQSDEEVVQALPDDAASRRSRSLEVDDVEQDAERKLEHRLKESVYEAAILIGVPGLGRSGSFLVALGLLLNVAARSIFSYVIRVAFIKGASLPSVEGAKQWRYSEGHLLNNMGVATEASLVSRVCMQDKSLSVSTDKQQLYQAVTLYRKGGVGVLLTALVLLVWFFYFAQEFDRAFSFVVAVYGHEESGSTRVVRRKNGSVALQGMSLRRKRAMLAVSFIRVLLGFVLLTQGARWLSMTIGMQDLVLNGVALAFIIELDQTFFDICTTWATKVLVSELEPLPKKYGRFQAMSSTVLPVLNLISASVFVIVMVTTLVIPMSQTVADIADALCGYPQDFVYAVHETGLIFASMSSPFQDNSMNTAIERVRDEGSLAGAGTVQVLPSVSALKSWSHAMTSEVVYNLASQIMEHGCEDYPFDTAGTLPHIGASLKRVLGDETLTSCEDVRHNCTGLHFMVRIVCPDTCGCSLPRTGLYRNGPDRGCPLTVCQQSAKYQAALAALPCEDPTPEELRAMASWRRYWSQWVHVNLDVAAARAKEFEAVGAAFNNQGCAGMSQVSQSQKEVLCRGTTIVASMADFCPLTCNCTTNRFPNCPSSC